MIYDGEFIKAQFIERPNRFLSLVRVGDREEYAHVANPGRLTELLLPGVPVVLKKESNPKRKTRYTLSMVYKDGVLVAVNAMLANRLAGEAIENGNLREFEGYRVGRREVTYKTSRLDFLLSKGETLCFLEVKSVTLVKDRTAMFPDAPTIRGTRHIHHLLEAMDEGYEAALLFVVQRHDADRFMPNSDTDPEFASALRQAKSRGVKLAAYTHRISIGKLELDKKISVSL